MRPDQQMQHRRQQPVRHLPAKLMIHLPRDKEAAPQLRGHRFPRRRQIFRQIFSFDLRQPRQRARRLQADHYVHRTLRKQQRHGQRVRTAERIKHRQRRRHLLFQFLRLKSFESTDQPSVGVLPCRVQQTPVFLPFVGFFKFRERTSRSSRQSRQKSPRVIRVTRQRNRVGRNPSIRPERTTRGFLRRAPTAHRQHDKRDE